MSGVLASGYRRESIRRMASPLIVNELKMTKDKRSGEAEAKSELEAEKRRAEEDAVKFDALLNPEQEKWIQPALADLSPVLRGG